MGARTKLNTFYFVGCAVGAVAVGVAFDSWIAFALTLAVGLGLKAYDGAIRLDPPKRPRGRQ